MQYVTFVVLVALACTVSCLPIDSEVKDVEHKEAKGHSLWKRFVNPMFAFGGSSDTGLRKMRTKRQAGSECEKLSLCKLHARSNQSPLAAFELYFVNKRNAKLWDHQARTEADCERRFGDCYDEEY